MKDFLVYDDTMKLLKDMIFLTCPVEQDSILSGEVLRMQLVGYLVVINA